MKSPELGLCGIGVATEGLAAAKLGIPPDTGPGIPNCRGVGGVDEDVIDEGTIGDGLGIGARAVSG